jgi:hypothetical protein
MADRVNAVGNEKHGISPKAVLGENGLIARFNGHIRATKKGLFCLSVVLQSVA